MQELMGSFMARWFARRKEYFLFSAGTILFKNNFIGKRARSDCSGNTYRCFIQSVLYVTPETRA